MTTRTMRELYDLEREDDDRLNSKITRAVDKACESVDYQTIHMLLKRGLPLPERLHRIYKRYEFSVTGADNYFKNSPVVIEN